MAEVAGTRVALRPWRSLAGESGWSGTGWYDVWRMTTRTRHGRGATDPTTAPVALVQRAVPTDGSVSRRVSTLPVDRVQPIIRIAHRQKGPLRIAERIILDHEFVLILGGEGTLTLRDGGVPFSAHHLLFIPPFVPHGFVSVGICEHVAVHFDFCAAQPRLDSHPERRRPYEIRFPDGLEIPSRLPLSPSDGIEDGFLEVVRTFSDETPAGRLAAHGRLTTLIATLLRARQQRHAVSEEPGSLVGRTKLERSLVLMRTRFTEPLTSADLAKASGLSHSRFSHLFKELTGYSPKDYLRRLRIDAARKLLADIDLSIKEVAARTGFDDQYHFSRVFRQIDGLSPTLFREATLAARGHAPGAAEVDTGRANPSIAQDAEPLQPRGRKR